MEKDFLRLRELAIEFPDGTIFRIAKLQPVFEGWVVRIDGKTDYEGESGMIDAINEAAQTTKTVAVSKDGNLEIWDVVEIFDNEEDATKAGKENGQMTIYQIETSRLKWID
jgi:hypothetical protein